MSNWETKESFIKKLGATKFPDEELEWRATKLQAFRKYVETLFARELTTEHKIEWKEEHGQLRLSVISKDLGILSVNIELNKIKSNKVPKDLPEQLLSGFQSQFQKKIKRLINKYEKESNPTEDVQEDGLQSRGQD
jgi:hypothetical protein